ncbi:hypothetical protein MMC10_008831 [Thelotrema lepadinum]|nr:hypothetical protein [Thelotrema lepadinum]
MLRRPPTEIKLTPEDVAAYDESRLARLQAEEQARIRAENAYLEGQLQGRAGNAGAEANATLEEKGDASFPPTQSTATSQSQSQSYRTAPSTQPRGASSTYVSATGTATGAGAGGIRTTVGVSARGSPGVAPMSAEERRARERAERIGASR